MCQYNSCPFKGYLWHKYKPHLNDNSKLAIFLLVRFWDFRFDKVVHGFHGRNRWEKNSFIQLNTVFYSFFQPFRGRICASLVILIYLIVDFNQKKSRISINSRPKIIHQPPQYIVTFGSSPDHDLRWAIRKKKTSKEAIS